MDKEEQNDSPYNIDPFLFFAVMLGILSVKSEYNDDPEEECKPEY